MDEVARTFLIGAYQYLKGQQEEINNLQIVTFALRQTVRELGPDAETLYGKHYLAASQSPGKTAGDGVVLALDQLIRQLSGQN